MKTQVALGRGVRRFCFLTPVDDAVERRETEAAEAAAQRDVRHDAEAKLDDCFMSCGSKLQSRYGWERQTVRARKGILQTIETKNIRSTPRVNRPLNCSTAAWVSRSPRPRADVSSTQIVLHECFSKFTRQTPWYVPNRRTASESHASRSADMSAPRKLFSALCWIGQLCCLACRQSLPWATFLG